MTETAQRQVNPIHFFDAQSALQLSQTKDIISDIFYDFCGLQQVKKGNTTSLQRITRPTFTYEFAKELTTKLYVAINRITGRTTYNDHLVNEFVYNMMKSLRDWFSEVGFHQLISEKAWLIIKSLNRQDTRKIYQDETTKEKFYLTYWQSKYGISWDENDFVSDYMLRIVKRDYELEDESFGQLSIMRSTYDFAWTFIHGSINRSLNALSLDHEKVIHKESTVIDNKKDARQNEGFIERTKSGLRKVFNG